MNEKMFELLSSSVLYNAEKYLWHIWVIILLARIAYLISVQNKWLKSEDEIDNIGK